jgi:hypothetical protein
MAKTTSSQALFCTLIRSNGINKVFKALEGVLAFGEDTIVERAAVVINEQLDHMSMAVHKYYAKIYNDSRPWQQLTNYERESSRALALHINTKLYALNMGTVENKNACETSGEYEALISSKPEVLENLAIGEHMRWCAHLATHGWTLPPKEIEFKRSDCLKQHPCLVGWDDLDRISQAANKDYQEIDRQLVVSLPAIAANGHMKIVKRMS